MNTEFTKNLEKKQMKDLAKIFENFLSEEPIVVYSPVFGSMLGSVKAGLLFSLLSTYSKTFGHKKFFVSDVKIHKDTGMTFSELKESKRKVIDSGLFTSGKEGLPLKTFYQINLNKLGVTQ